VNDQSTNGDDGDGGQGLPLQPGSPGSNGDGGLSKADDQGDGGPSPAGAGSPGLPPNLDPDDDDDDDVLVPIYAAPDLSLPSLGQGPPPVVIHQLVPGEGWISAPPPPPRRPKPWVLAQRFPATTILGLAITTMFALQGALGGTSDPSAMARLGAVRHDLVFERFELYRLLCAAFLHAGWFHFLVNGFAFVQLALISEAIYGSRRMLVAYLASAIGGTLASSTFHFMPSVGASGALLGLAGLLLVSSRAAPRAWRDDTMRRTIGRRLVWCIGLTFALGIGLYLWGFPLVDNWGHLGGLLTGFGIGLAYREPALRTGRVVTAGALGLGLMTLGSFAWMGVDGHGAANRLEADMALVQERILAEDPDDPRAEFVLPALVEYYMRTHQEQDAERVLLLWLARAPDEPSVLNDLAWHLLIRRDLERRAPGAAACLATRAVQLQEPLATDIDGQRILAMLLDTLALAQQRAGWAPQSAETDRRLQELAERLLIEAPETAAEQLGHLVTSHYRQGERDQALRAAIRLIPVRGPRDPTVLNAVAWHLVEPPGPTPLHAAVALPLARTSVRLLDQPGLAETPAGRQSLAASLDTLAEAERLCGRPRDALRYQQRAVELLDGQWTEPELLEKILTRLHELEAEVGLTP
jgi:rhomboid protease GluP